MKKEKPKNRSLRSRLMLLVGSSIGLCLVLLTVYSLYSVQIVRRQASELNRNTITLQCNAIDVLLSQGSQYLLTLSTMLDDIETVGAHETASTEYHLAGWRILQRFQNGHQQYNHIDGTFLYIPETDTYITSSASDLGYETRHSAQAQVTRYLKSRRPTYSDYFTLEIEGGFIVVKILPAANGYIGIWCTTDTLLAALKTAQVTQIDYIAFLSDDNRVLDSGPLFSSPLITKNSRGETCTELGGRRYILSRCASRSGNFSLIALVSEQKLLENFQMLYLVILAMAVLLIIMVVAASLTCKSILSSLRSLADAMNRIRQGDWDLQPEADSAYDEFQLFQTTFRSMVLEIRRLKMDIYEEKLQRQRIKRQFYQIQIQPHFFMNALNMVYQLAQAESYELIQQLALHLSAYFRYSLKNREELVQLRDELAFIKEYLEIQKIRYPYNLEIETVIDPQMLDQLIPTLTVQTFVENAIKYAVSMDTVTRIRLLAEEERRPSGTRLLKISIQDNGPGFPPKELEALAQGRQIVSGGRERLGIYNVQQRLQLIYHEKGSIAFSNRKPHGAQVEIRLPAEP